MASIEKISKSYRGVRARDYDKIRDKQKRWHAENKIVEEMLRAARSPGPVFDCPVGTGRFLGLYQRLKLNGVGLDSSRSMLDLASKKPKPRGFKLVQGSADELGYKNNEFDVCVCVRFLNLIEGVALVKVLKELDRVTRRHMILTIRLGEDYQSNSDMCTHNERVFRSFIKRLGWRVVRDETEPFVKGWHLIHLERGK